MVRPGSEWRARIFWWNISSSSRMCHLKLENILQPKFPHSQPPVLLTFRFYGYIHCFSLDGLKRGCFLPLSSLCHLYELWRTVMDPTVKTKQDKEKFPLFLLTEWAQAKTFQSWQRQWINSWNWHKWQRYWWWHYALWISDLSKDLVLVQVCPAGRLTVKYMRGGPRN